MNSQPPPVVTLDGMRQDIAILVGKPAPAISDDADLVGIGLDSLGVMKLVTVWRSRGARVKFAELIERRTLADWWTLVSSRLILPELKVDPVNIDEDAPFDLSTMQLAYWIGRSSSQTLGVGCHYYFEFDGRAIEPARLEQAVYRIFERHGMLRAIFLQDGRQRILPRTAWPGLKVHDFRSIDANVAATQLAAIRDGESNRKLQVEKAEGLDVQLSLMPNHHTRVHLNIDMLVSDALSFRILIDELAQLYVNPETHFPPLRYSYPKYLAQKATLRQDDWKRAQRYWKTHLQGLPGAPQLPLAMEPGRLEYPRVTRREHRLSPAAWGRLSELSHQHGLTVSVALMAVYVEVLAAWSSEPRFVLNVPLFDRENLHPDVSKMVGDFSNSFLLAVDASEDLPFLERARQLQTRLRSDAANSYYSGLEVLRDLSRAYPEQAATAAAVVFTSALGMGDLFGQRARDTFGSLAWMMSQTAQVWLDQQITELNGGILLNWDCMEPLFPPGVLNAMFAAYRELLEWLTGPAADWSRSIPGLLPREQRQMRARANSSVRAQSGRLLHQGFFEHAALRPQRTALAWGADSQLSYGELAARAKRIARALLQKGLKAGDCVAVVLPKGPEQIEAVLGVLYAGGAYVPVGVDQPARRRARIYSTSGIRLVLTSAGSSISQHPDFVQVLTLEECALTTPLENPPSLTAESLAYVIFTSGSTGDPKGVMVSHRAAMNTIEDILDRFGINERDSVLAVSSLDFDWSVADIFELLSVGGKLVLIGEESRRDADAWVDLVRRWQITLWQSVPALLDMLLTAAAERDLGLSLRLVMLGGDWVGLDQYERLRKVVPHCRLVALGGITETSIHCTVHEITEVLPHWKSIPYGVPLRNVKCRVVNQRGQDCPDWVPGELWVGGKGVSNGYLNDPERTARQFVEYDGERWYRSGDMARYWPDGTLEFLGRADSQVKIRGHRIELGEIQAALQEYPHVAQTCVTTVGEKTSQLAAAIVADPELDLAGLRSFLADRLPPYMVPEHIAILESLPLTENGKIDRAEIRRLLSHGEMPGTCDPPQGEIEEAVATVWKKLFGVPVVWRDQSFFGLGGDSLLATCLGSSLRAAGYEGFELHRLFNTPSLKDFAATLRRGEAAGYKQAIVIDEDRRHEPFPLTEIQRAYWLGRNSDFTLGGVGSYWYWEFDGSDVDLARLEEVIDHLVHRHEMLRAVLDESGRQVILPEVPCFHIGVATAPAGEEESALAEFRAGGSQKMMDPGRWPLFEVHALQYGAGRTRVSFGFDYIVLDALSIMIIFSEMAALYSDPGVALPPIGLSFRDYVLGMSLPPETVAAAREYWTKHASDLPPAPQLSLRKDPELISQPRFTRREARLAAPQWQAIKERARTHNLTASGVLASAFAEVLSAWSAQPELTLNLTLFDRADIHPDINKVVGDFTSLLLVPYRPVSAAGWNANARDFQEQLWMGLQYKSVSAISVMREIARQAGRAEMPFPVVFTSTLGVADELANLSMPFGSYAGGLSQTPQVWLDNQVIEFNGDLLVNWDAVEELFPANMLDAMFAAYQELLQRLARPDFDWHQPIVDLLPASQREVRKAVNATSGPVTDRVLHEAFFQHAMIRPERLALAWGDDSQVSYGELAQQALRVAAFLRQQQVQAGDAVGVTMPKGPGQIAAVLGVLAAGGVYVPVGVEQPVARRQLIYARAGVRIVLEDLTQALQCAPLDGPLSVHPDSLAYVIFTSGSTGEPKGVEITHRAAMNTVEDINARFQVGENDSVLAVSALDFDLSVYDIFGLLSAGGKIVLINEDIRREARSWAGLARRWNITIWNSVPALLDMLLSAGASSGLGSSLRLAMLSGDWVGLDLRPRLASLVPHCRLVALGGATEAAIWSNWFDVVGVPEHWRSIPYGHPLRNQKFRVVDASGRNAPDWVPGELWIGGLGVAAGYRGDPDLTGRKFVLYEGERWYRTGDLGRYWPDGTLEFVGRTDHQVKVRGHRIELGEVESALTEHPDITRSVVVAVGEKVRTLAACIVPGENKAPDLTKLRQFLSEKLPTYMIPERIVSVDCLPLSANGKIDRQALLNLLNTGAAPSGENAPKGPVEEAVAELWAALLGVPHVACERSFFVLGGDSLLATRMVEVLERQFGLQISLRQLFAAPTVRDLAAIILQQRPELESGMEEGIV